VEKDGEVYLAGNFDDQGVIHGLVKVEGEELVIDENIDMERANTHALFHNGHWYSIGNGDLYMDDQLLAEINTTVIYGSRPTSLLVYNNTLLIVGFLNHSDIFMGDSGNSHLYKILEGENITNLHPQGHEINAYFDSNSDFFHIDDTDYTNNTALGFNYPSDSLIKAFYGAELVACATANGDTLAAGPRYSGTEEKGWRFGPIADELSSEYVDRYYRVWKVTSQQIQNHIVMYNQPNYVIPEVIANWPGNGRFEAGEAYTLAPFVDINANNSYEPWAGDYPKIEGDEAIYLIFNDKYITHYTMWDQLPNETLPPLNLEIHLMFYAYANQIPPLSRTIFLRSTVYNRSENDYTDLRLGLFNDFDIGNPFDDFMGCDSLLHYSFAYNRDNDDEDVLPPGELLEVDGYGDNPPATACIFLNQPMASSIVATNQSSGGLIPPVPTTMKKYYSMMNGLDEFGDPLLYGGNDLGPMVFSDSPCTVEGENEVTYDLVSSDRQVINATEDIELSQGDYVCFDVAFTVSSENLNYVENACSLEDIVVFIKEFYANNSLNDCEYLVSTNDEELANEGFRVYPVPANERLNVLFDNQNASDGVLRMFNITGQVVFETQIQNGLPGISIPTSSLASGVYLVQFNESSKNIMISHE
jgi:hypothetical protein